VIIVAPKARPRPAAEPFSLDLLNQGRRASGIKTFPGFLQNQIMFGFEQLAC
jgi:hypothetical protein